MCGEQVDSITVTKDKAGSPPRVRGTVAFFFAVKPFKGITPACAGNRLAGITPECPLPDHPRVCGEQQTDAYERITGVGSPPRVRGTALFQRWQGRFSRITPACAGNSQL